MKICFLGDAASIHIRRWCEYFRDKGHEVSIISFRVASIDGVSVHCVNDKLSVNSEGGNISYLKKIFKIRSIVKSIKPDIVNAHYLTSYGLIGTLVGKKPLVVSTWGSDILVTPKRNIVYKELTKFVIRKCNLVTSDSKFMSKEIVNLGGNPNNIITVPMGINKNDFNAGNRVKDSKVFLSMRTLCDNSNIGIILRAFEKMLKIHSDVKLILTNSGDKEDYVKQLIKELSIENSVEFMGFVSREQVSFLLKSSQVYLSIPTSDSTSVNLLEAMASGIFPIVSDLPANREWINNDENGYVLEELTEECLLKYMIKSLEEKELVEKSIEINKQIISERAIWDDNMAIVEEKYLELIG
ncbi:MAG: glycosyltransferase [Clostridium sp.]|uniref:glycosyltransferase n=1 Tax=Clostridium sp. TaxID=1506 RepID=UPI003044A696